MRYPLRLAGVAEAGTVAGLLDAFNREFGTATPGVDVLTARLHQLLGGDSVFAVLAGDEPVGVGLVTLRPNVWYDGPVALLDELFVVPRLRGQGIGSAVLAHAEVVARERGAELMEINVDGADVDARRFYERHGYTNVDVGQAEPSFYYYRQLANGSRATMPHDRGASAPAISSAESTAAVIGSRGRISRSIWCSSASCP